MKRGVFMEMFHWSDQFDVGVEEINKQHKHLIDSINQLSNAMHEGKSKDVLGKVLKELIDYGVYHFDTEEKYFNKYHYPNRVAHINEHNSFKETVTKLYQEFEAGSFRVSIETLHFLKDWITKHIKDIDMQYKEFFEDKI